MATTLHLTSMFHDIENANITGGTFNICQYTGKDHLFDEIHNAFKGHIAPNAMHDTKQVDGQRQCQDGTCVELLKELSESVKDANSPTRVTWLHGSAGSGKSTVCRSLAKQLDEEKSLAGSFFFFRTDPSRNSVERLIPTLAYQIAYSIPEIRQFIAEAVRENPEIFQKSLKTQWEKLITKPVTQLAASDLSQGRSLTTQTKLILIDGLDQCENRKDWRTLFDALSPCLGGQIKLLIASRLERDIKESFKNLGSKENLRLGTKVVNFMERPSIHHDIRLYLNDRFAEIKSTHPQKNSFLSSWPSADSVKELVRKSSGQFTFAHTVMEYIEHPCGPYPEKRLDIILGWEPTPGNPYAEFELDSLYSQILSSSRADRETLINVLMVQFAFRVRRLKMTPRHPYHVCRALESDAFTASILGLELREVRAVFVDLSSLVILKESTIRGPDCRPAQSMKVNFIDLATSTSFMDFLFDPLRSGEFHMDFETACTTLCKRCLDILNDQNFPAKKYWSNFTGNYSLAQSIDAPGWKITTIYYFALVSVCQFARPDPDLQAAMFSCDLLNFSSRNECRCMGDFMLFRDAIDIICSLDSERVPAFVGTDLFNHHSALFDKFLKSELDYWVLRDSGLVNVLKETIFINHIDWEKLKMHGFQMKSVPNLRPACLGPARYVDSHSNDWQNHKSYFLDWLAGFAGSPQEQRFGSRVCLFICSFFHSKDRAGQYYIEGESVSLVNRNP